MKTSLQKITEKTKKNLELEDEQIQHIIREALQILAQEEMPHIQKTIERYESSQYKHFGKLELLEEMQEL